jgi:glycosyltransferase involved in cell wall biosynthesis
VHIAYFCQYFTPEVAAPAARVSELSQAWANAGNKVTVVTGLPNHPTGRVPADYQGVWFRREQSGQVEVWRNWLYATPNEGFVKKTLSHLSFMLSTLLFSVPRLRGVDVIIVSSPTFFVVMTVCVAHWLWRRPYVFEVRDLWPGVFVELGVIRNRPLIVLLEALEMFLYRRASLVVVVTESFRETLIARGLPAEHVRVVTNGVDLELFKPNTAGAASLRKQLGFDTQFMVLYIGAHGISHALSRILDVAAKFTHQADVSFVFVGDGAEKQRLSKDAEARGLDNVRFFPSQSRETMTSWYGAADVVLVPLRNIALFETFIPSKMFEILACERPIIGSVRGEARRILEQSEAALVVDPEDVDAIAESIQVLRSDPRRRESLATKGRIYVRARYDRRALASEYLRLLKGVTEA